MCRSKTKYNCYRMSGFRMLVASLEAATSFRLIVALLLFLSPLAGCVLLFLLCVRVCVCVCVCVCVRVCVCVCVAVLLPTMSIVTTVRAPI